MPFHTDEARRKNSERFANISEADLTPAKAKKILKDGEVQGEPLTSQQKDFFGAAAGGEKPRK